MDDDSFAYEYLQLFLVSHLMNDKFLSPFGVEQVTT